MGCLPGGSPHAFEGGLQLLYLHLAPSSASLNPGPGVCIEFHDERARFLQTPTSSRSEVTGNNTSFTLLWTADCVYGFQLFFSVPPSSFPDWLMSGL